MSWNKNMTKTPIGTIKATRTIQKLNCIVSSNESAEANPSTA